MSLESKTASVAKSHSADDAFAKIVSVLNTKITLPSKDSEAIAKIVSVLNTKITLPALPKKLMADINRQERTAGLKEALAFLSTHEAVTRGNAVLAAELITETLARIMGNEYTGVWLLSPEGDRFYEVDGYVVSQTLHDVKNEYMRSQYPKWFESLINQPQIVVRNEKEMLNLKPEFFESNKKRGIKSGLETVIYSYAEPTKVIGLLQSDDVTDGREFTGDEMALHREAAKLMAMAVHNDKSR